MPDRPNNVPATKADLEALEQRLKKTLNETLNERFEGAIKALREYIDERTHDAETRLLRAFSDYQQGQTTRFRHMKADLGNLNAATDERLAALEERVTNVEKRLILKNI